MKGKGKNKFKSGDVVRLISGGPDMTVIKKEVYVDLGEHFPNTRDWVDCIWFDKHKRQTGHFPPYSLEHVKRKNGGLTK